MTKVLLAFVS